MPTDTKAMSQGTYVSYGAPNNNYDANDWIRCGVQSTTSTRYIPTIEFDLSGIPSFAQIAVATLRMYSFNDGFTWNASTNIHAKRNTSAFDEGSVTYNTRPSTTDTNQALFTGGGYDTWYEWSVKDIVQAWINGTANYGFTLIQADLTTARGKCFKRTGEYAPQLYVEFTEPVIFNGQPVSAIIFNGNTVTGLVVVET